MKGIVFSIDECNYPSLSYSFSMNVSHTFSKPTPLQVDYNVNLLAKIIEEISNFISILSALLGQTGVKFIVILNCKDGRTGMIEMIYIINV